MSAPKITLIGAGGLSFGPTMVNDVIHTPSLAGSRLVLHDVNEQRLLRAYRFAVKLNAANGAPVILDYSTDPGPALEGANFCLSSAEFGRFKYWHQDYEIPLRFGATQVNGENGGPGAVFHSLRSIKNTLSICASIEKYCPDAFLLNLSNPMSRVTLAINEGTNGSQRRHVPRDADRHQPDRPHAADQALRDRGEGVGHQSLHLLHRVASRAHGRRPHPAGEGAVREEVLRLRAAHDRTGEGGRHPTAAGRARRPALLAARHTHDPQLRHHPMLSRQPHRRVPAIRARDRRPAPVARHPVREHRQDRRTTDDARRRHETPDPGAVDGPQPRRGDPDHRRDVDRHRPKW